MGKQILLVEPDYYSQFPPIGLLKLSTYNKNLGNNVKLVKGCRFPTIEDFPFKKPDEIYVTSLFTWAYKSVWSTIKYYRESFPKATIHLGGVYATLYPEHAKLSGADYVHEGVFLEAEDLMPDYSLVPNWDGSIITTSRGCIRKCKFCPINSTEGDINMAKQSIKHLVVPTHTRIFCFDNNILANPYWENIFDELIEMKKKVDFNQGLDSRLITSDVVQKLSKINIKPYIRTAYDTHSQELYVKQAIKLFSNARISPRNIVIYALYNHDESPDEFLERVKDILNWGSVCYPMRYEPSHALNKNEFISKKWTAEQLEAIQKMRRVMGCHGAFPPSEALKTKFNSSRNFEEVFKLREQK